MGPETVETVTGQPSNGALAGVTTSVLPCVGCGHGFVPTQRSGTSLCASCLFGLAMELTDDDLPNAEKDKQNALPVNALTLGPYVLIEEIGRGGMGVIYRALHRDTHEEVAVKTVAPQEVDSPETLARFQREAEAAQSLAHPYLMPIREVGVSTEGVPYFSMQLALGGSLHQVMAKYQGRWVQIAELMAKVSSAIHQAHCQGIIHRDLKPGNVLFTEDFEPLVTDFGLVKRIIGSDDLTHSCAVLGTPSYVSPEQAMGKTREVTAATDIYSLGAILFELLTGRPPFVGDNPLDVLRQVADGTPPYPRQIAPAVPESLENICLRCLEREPEDRYATARELEDDLGRWLEGREVKAKPRRPRWWRLIKRHPMVGALVVTLLLASFPAWWFWENSAREALHLQSGLSTVVLIQDWSQNAASGDVIEQLANGLRHGLVGSQTLRLQEQKPTPLAGYKEELDPLTFGRSSGAQTVLTSLVRRSGNRLRLLTQLRRCDDGKVMWRRAISCPTDRTATEIPLMTTALLNDLEGRLASRSAWNQVARHVPSPEAQVFYDRAMEISVHNTSSDFVSAAALFTRASELDSQFALAYAMKAYALWSLAEVDETKKTVPLALTTARQALSLDPDLAQAHRVIASCYLRLGRKAEAVEEFWKSVEIDPQSAGCWISLGTCLRTVGHPVQALPYMRHAARLAPVRGSIQGILAETLMICGQDEQAASLFRHVLELEDDQPDVQADLGALLTWQRRFGEARALCDQLQQRFPNSRFGLTLAAWIELCDGHDPTAKELFEKLREKGSYRQRCRFYGAVNPSSALAYLAKQAGREGQARTLALEALVLDRQILDEDPDEFRVLHDLAATYAVQGEIEQALTCLQQAVEKGWVEVRSTSLDPRFSELANLPRFKELLGRMAANLR